MSEFLRVERSGPLATLWIDRRARMNTMTVAMRHEFPGIFRELDADDGVRVVVVRGAGGKAFSAGGDLAEFLTLAPADLELWGDTPRIVAHLFPIDSVEVLPGSPQHSSCPGPAAGSWSSTPEARATHPQPTCTDTCPATAFPPPTWSRSATTTRGAGSTSWRRTRKWA